MYSVQAIAWEGKNLTACKYGLWFFVTNPTNKYGFYVEKPWLIPYSDWMKLVEESKCTIKTGSGIIVKTDVIKFNGLYNDTAHTIFMCAGDAFNESLSDCVRELHNRGLLL